MAVTHLNLYSPFGCACRVLYSFDLALPQDERRHYYAAWVPPPWSQGLWPSGEPMTPAEYAPFLALEQQVTVCPAHEELLTLPTALPLEARERRQAEVDVLVEALYEEGRAIGDLSTILTALRRTDLAVVYHFTGTGTARTLHVDLPAELTEDERAQITEGLRWDQRDPGGPPRPRALAVALRG